MEILQSNPKLFVNSISERPQIKNYVLRH